MQRAWSYRPLRPRGRTAPRFAGATLLAAAIGCAPMGLPPDRPGGTAPAPAPTVPGRTDAPPTGAPSRHSVGEIVRIADTDARPLLSGTYQVRGQVVGSVNGEGCSDFVMLVDPEDASTYQKLFDPGSSDAEFQRARAIPMVMAGPTAGFPGGVLDHSVAVFQGRFVRCDGALRFRIERAAAVPASAPAR